MAEFVADRVLFNNEMRLLDVGCGTGMVGESLRTYGATGYLKGVDISPDMIQVAKEKQAYNDLSVVDLNEDPLTQERASYDGIVCYGTVSYFESPDIIDVLVSLAAPGGFICFDVRTDKEAVMMPRIEQLLLEGALVKVAEKGRLPEAFGNPSFGQKKVKRNILFFSKPPLSS